MNRIKTVHLFQKIFRKNFSSEGIAAISFTSEGIALAVSLHPNELNPKPKLIHCEFIYTNNRLNTLKQLTESHNLKNYDCHLVLASDHYRLITIAPPAVTEAEMSEAVRWKISDLVEFHIEDAIIDHYPLPISQRANSENKMEVVATAKSTIQPLVDLCTSCELQLKVIDIQETSIKNLATLLPENNGIAILHLQKTTGQIIIEQKGLIHLSRKLAMGFERLGLTDAFLSEGQIELEQNNLALDIQRSYDYIESYYSHPPISELVVIPVVKNTQNILDFLNSKHGITSRVMDISTMIDSDILLNDSTQSLCAPVIGATLRETVNPI